MPPSWLANESGLVEEVRNVEQARHAGAKDAMMMMMMMMMIGGLVGWLVMRCDAMRCDEKVCPWEGFEDDNFVDDDSAVICGVRAAEWVGR